MRVKIDKGKVSNKLLSELMKEPKGFYNIFVKLISTPDSNQTEILAKLGLICDSQVFSATVPLKVISQISCLDFVDGVGMMGRPETAVVPEIPPALESTV